MTDAPTVTARIRPAKGGALWILIDREGKNKASAEDLNWIQGDSPRSDDDLNNVAYAILPDEVTAIRDACEVWLDERTQSLMEKVLGKEAANESF